MTKYRFTSLCMVVVFMLSIVISPKAYGEERTFVPVYDSFDDREDGYVPTQEVDGWKIYNNRQAEGDIAEIQGGRLRIVTDAPIGTTVMERKLQVPFTGSKVLVQFSVEIVSNTDLNNMFPGVGTNGSSGTTQIQQGGTGIKSLVDSGQGGDKSFSMKIEVGKTYDFGLLIDLNNKTQDIFIKNSDGIIESVSSGFRTTDTTQIEYLKFWLDTWNGGATGEFYFDNFIIDEATGDPLLHFYDTFILGDDGGNGDVSEDEDIIVDELTDIIEKIGNAMVVSTNSSYAFTNGERTKIDDSNDDIVPIMENDEILVPASFVAEHLGASSHWNQDTKEITMTKGAAEVKFTVDSKIYTVNDQENQSNAAARMISKKVFVSLQAITQAFGKHLYWNGNGVYGISEQEYLLDSAADQAIIDKLVSTFGIYISTNGNDANAGTMEAPFRTLKKARDYLREMKTGDGLPTGGMTFYIAGGEYRFNNTLLLSKEDSGRTDSPITYRSIHGEEVRFTGAFNIPTDEFVPVSDEMILNRLYEGVRGKVQQVDLNALGLSDFGAIRRANVFTREAADSTGLILDNIPQTLARWPNEGYVKTGDISTGDDTTTVGFAENAPERWSNAEEPWAQGFWQYEWRDDTLPIKDMNMDDKVFTFDNTTDGFKKGQHYYVFNLLEEIDQPGEWYLDRIAGILYYYPPVEMNNNKLQLSLLDKPMIEMTNTANIHIKGITFEASSSTGIVMNYAKNNQVTNSIFRNLGSQAINIKHGKNSGVIGCDIYDIGKGGVYLTGGDRPTLTYGENYIENSYFTRFNRSVKTYTPAILLDGVGNRITHNVIHDGPHEGIGVNGNDQFIEYNELYDLCKESGDSGGIYAGRDWTQQGITIQNNIIHGMHGNEEMGLQDVFGIYFDDALSGGIVKNNLFFDIDTPVNVHGGRSFTIDSNIVANAGKSMRLVNYAIPQTTELEARYAAMPVQTDLWKNKYPNIDTILEDDPRLPKYNVVTNTLNYNSGQMEIQPDVYTYGTIENNVRLTEDPGFADVDHDIFKLEAGFDGSQYGLNNFTPIDYDNVGLYIDHNRETMPQLSEFNLVSPSNRAQNVEGAGVRLNWIPSHGATKYQVMIATDENFNNIVLDEETKINSIFVSGLDYNTTDYYWRVKAISRSILYPDAQENNNGVYMFTTAESQAIDFTELTKAIEAAQTFAEGADAGTQPGQYPAEVKAKLITEIGKAEYILNDSTVTQEEVENEVSILNDAVATLKGSVNTALVDLGTLITKSSDWLAGNQNFLRFARNELTFTPEPGGLMVAAYKEKLPKYFSWKMKATFDFGEEGDKWQGFGLRASDPQSVGWRAYASYIVIIKENQIEVQNFHDGSNRSVTPDIENNGIIETGKEYNIELGALNVKDGVRLTLTVDGETIFDVVDQGDGNNRYIDDSGYFVIYSSQGYDFKLAGVEEVEEVVITSIDPVKVSTAVGVEPVLPTEVTVVTDKGLRQQETVQWDPIDPQEYEQEGSFTVEGTVAGTELKAVATVRVEFVSVYEAVYDSIDYLDGTTQLDGWNYSNNKPSQGDIFEVEDGQLKVVTSAPEGTLVIQRRLYNYPEKFYGNKGICQFRVKVDKLTGFESMLPGIGANNSDGTTQIQVSGDGTVKSVVAEGQGGDKTFEMKIEEGNTYDFGLIIDLQKQTQDIYIKNVDTGEIDSVTSGFKTAGFDNIEYIKFWLGGSSHGVGTFYFDNLSFKEASPTALEQFYLNLSIQGK